jgi:hypothetical protein
MAAVRYHQEAYSSPGDCQLYRPLLVDRAGSGQCPNPNPGNTDPGERFPATADEGYANQGRSHPVAASAHAADWSRECPRSEAAEQQAESADPEEELGVLAVWASLRNLTWTIRVARTRASGDGRDEWPERNDREFRDVPPRCTWPSTVRVRSLVP